MSPPSAYEMLASGELDPVSCLEQYQISEENLFDIRNLGRVLVSFGDFKDTGYRLKIRKDQATTIQTIGYLLEKYPAKQELGQRRKRAEGVGEGRGGKRVKRTRNISVATDEVAAAVLEQKTYCAEEFKAYNKSGYKQAEIDAALALLSLSARPDSRASKNPAPLNVGVTSRGTQPVNGSENAPNGVESFGVRRSPRTMKRITHSG